MTRPPHELLSDREYQVMLMIASGKTVSAIADELFLSVKTISTYRTHILEKMRTSATSAAVVIQNNMVSPIRCPPFRPATAHAKAPSA